MASVRYGCVGVGLMGVEHIMNLMKIDRAEVVAIADTFLGSITACKEAMEQEQPGSTRSIRVFGGDTAVVDFAKSKNCDVCIVATPNFSHVNVLREIVDHGDPSMGILCEKPLCTTIEDCRDVLTMARGRKGFVLVGLEYSYMPPVAKLIRECRAGTIGSVKMCFIREHRFPFLRKVRNWNRLNINSGGTLVEKCCHFFDLFNRILSPAVPTSVYATGAQSVNFLDEDSNILDNAYVSINYCDETGGIVSRATLDLCMFAEASNSQEEVSVVGDKGKLEAFLPSLEFRIGLRDVHSLGNVSSERENDDRILYDGFHHGSSFLEHLDILHRVQSQRGAAPPPTSVDQMGRTAGLEQGLMSVAIGIAGQLSIAEGRVVRLDEVVSDTEISACRWYAEDIPHA